MHRFLPLRQLRQSLSGRHDLAWSVHREAGTKERLAAAIARCPAGERLTRELIRKALVEIEADAQREREAAYEATRLASRKILNEEVRAEKAVHATQTESRPPAMPTRRTDPTSNSKP
jgi:hypothetical protein